MPNENDQPIEHDYLSALPAEMKVHLLSFLETREHIALAKLNQSWGSFFYTETTLLQDPESALVSLTPEQVLATRQLASYKEWVEEHYDELQAIEQDFQQLISRIQSKPAGVYYSRDSRILGCIETALRHVVKQGRCGEVHAAMTTIAFGAIVMLLLYLVMHRLTKVEIPKNVYIVGMSMLAMVGCVSILYLGKTLADLSRREYKNYPLSCLEHEDRQLVNTLNNEVQQLVSAIPSNSTHESYTKLVALRNQLSLCFGQSGMYLNERNSSDPLYIRFLLGIGVDFTSYYHCAMETLCQRTLYLKPTAFLQEIVIHPDTVQQQTEKAEKVHNAPNDDEHQPLLPHPAPH